jgi:prepilin-type N-terminal cleavage/methylation domain-containing protein
MHIYNLYYLCIEKKGRRKIMKLFKKLNKGFTLVELVVVIAVIAILSAVSVVAYTGITKRAKESVALQEAKQRYTEVLAVDVADGVIDLQDNGTAISDPATTGFSLNTEVNAKSEYKVSNWEASNHWTVSFDGSVWTATEPSA